jgi:exosortase
VNGHQLALTLTHRHAVFGAFVVLSVSLFWRRLVELFTLALTDERHSYQFMILPVVAGFLWIRRDSAFLGARSEFRRSFLLAVLSALIYTLPLCISVPRDYELSVQILGVVLLWIGGFLGVYGPAVLGAMAFPALFLLLLVPVPSSLSNSIVHFLQEASASVAFWIFRLCGLPVFRDGFTLSLPGVNIEVARECSGIRSTTSLLVMTGIAGGMFLQSGWRRVLLAAMAIPIVIIKNALRIVTISLLGLYVDPGFFHGALHRNSGIPFSILAILMLLPIFLGLRSSERSLASRLRRISNTGSAATLRRSSTSIPR